MLTRILASTAIVLALAAPAVAQQSGEERQERQERATQEQEQRDESLDDRPMNQLSLAEADVIQGSSVRNRQGEDIGSVEDVVLDVKKGQVAFAIVGVGGFLGVGEKNVAVPWSRLQPGEEPQSFTLNVDRATLEQAPAVDPNSLAALEDQQQRQRISQFWQQAENQQAQTPEQPPDQSSDRQGRPRTND